MRLVHLVRDFSVRLRMHNIYHNRVNTWKVYKGTILVLCVSKCVCVCERERVCVCSVCVCVFIKLHITAQSGPVILVILCHSH